MREPRPHLASGDGWQCQCGSGIYHVLADHCVCHGCGATIEAVPVEAGRKYRIEMKAR